MEAYIALTTPCLCATHSGCAPPLPHHATSTTPCQVYGTRQDPVTHVAVRPFGKELHSHTSPHLIKYSATVALTSRSLIHVGFLGDEFRIRSFPRNPIAAHSLRCSLGTYGAFESHAGFTLSTLAGMYFALSGITTSGGTAA
jgi:hypothetical protein